MSVIITTITIKKAESGWQVLRHKTRGLEKGEHVLATLCGGMIGKAMALDCAKLAASISLADKIVLDDGDTVTEWSVDA
jgi:hypothetical protein